MKTITISTENSETYSSISNFFIDYYMTDANGEFVKVYLYLVRLLNGNRQISVAEIADHFNLTEKDICRAIKYWVTKNALRLTFDGKGQPTGIVMLPLQAPELSLSEDADAFALLREDVKTGTAISQSAKAGDSVADAEPSVTESTTDPSPVRSGKIVPISAVAVDLSAPAKPDFSKKDLEKVLQDENWENIVYLVETLFGKTLSTSDTRCLLYIYDTLGFEIELFEYLVEYCATMDKKSCRYMEATAIGWYQDGIRTKEQAKEQHALLGNICRIVYGTLGLKTTAITTTTQELFKTWTQDYGFSEAIIKEACKRTAAAHPENPTIKYANGILTKWHNAGVKDFEGIRQADLAFEQEKSKKQTAKTNVKKSNNNFTNYTHSDMSSELDEMEQLFHKEVNKK